MFVSDAHLLNCVAGSWAGALSPAASSSPRRGPLALTCSCIPLSSAGPLPQLLWKNALFWGEGIPYSVGAGALWGTVLWPTACLARSEEMLGLGRRPDPCPLPPVCLTRQKWILWATSWSAAKA